METTAISTGGLETSLLAIAHASAVLPGRYSRWCSLRLSALCAFNLTQPQSDRDLTDRKPVVGFTGFLRLLELAPQGNSMVLRWPDDPYGGPGSGSTVHRRHVRVRGLDLSVLFLMDQNTPVHSLEAVLWTAAVDGAVSAVVHADAVLAPGTSSTTGLLVSGSIFTSKSL